MSKHLLPGLGVLFLLTSSSAGAQTLCPPGSAWLRTSGGRLTNAGPPFIADFVLKGIVKSRGEFSAMLEDCRVNNTYVVRAGQFIIDGRGTAIDAEGITFQITGERETSLPKPLTKRLTLKPEKK